MAKFIVGKKYRTKKNQIGKLSGKIVAKPGVVYTVVKDGHALRLARIDSKGREVSWHISQFDRSQFQEVKRG